MSALMVLALAEATGSISVEVGNIRNDRGRVVVDICPQDKFLEDDCPYQASAPARPGTTTVVIQNVPAGSYAAQAFHDENGNFQVDRGLFGVPREGVAFSRNARIRLSPPKWNDAVFVHTGRAEVIRFNMRYFMGPAGPSNRGR